MGLLATEEAVAQSRSEEVVQDYLAQQLERGYGRRKFKKVGETFDACSKGNGVRLFGRENGTGTFRDVTVAAGETKLIELPYEVKELRWYCGGSRERVANDDTFDWLTLERAGNGALHWTFLRETSSNEPSEASTSVAMSDASPSATPFDLRGLDLAPDEKLYSGAELALPSVTNAATAQDYCVTVYSASGGAVIGRETIQASSDGEAAAKGYRVMKKYCPIRCPYSVRRGKC
jgi:hypothetical protein